MSQVRAGTEAVAAALVGSLSSFSLIDVLDLLGRTNRSGELQVVARETDKRVWLDRGDLIDTTGTDPQAATLFELACIDDGWFYFTVADRVPDATSRTPLVSLLANLGPQVQEWRSLVDALPFASMVKMSSSTPADEVQIRSDQWQLLSLVGAGHTIRDIVDASDLHPLDTLRTLRELLGAGLIALESDRVGSPPDAAGTATYASESVPAGAMGTGGPGATRLNTEDSTAAPVAATPGSTREEPPSSDFPSRLPLPPFAAPTPAFAPPPPPPPPPAYSGSDTDQPGSTGLPPFSAPPAPPAEQASDTPSAASSADSADADADSSVQLSVMPPPISGDPWSTSIPAEPQAGDGTT